jgi:hypothetical protein
MSLRPVVLQTDRASVLTRRVLGKLIAKEEASADSANQPVGAGAGSQSG